MALATRCPHCGTTFRVAQDQLKLRAGVVRCGTCKQIFNGIESLVTADAAAPAVAAPMAETPAVAPSAPALAAAAPAVDAIAEPVIVEPVAAPAAQARTAPVTDTVSASPADAPERAPLQAEADGEPPLALDFDIDPDPEPTRPAPPAVESAPLSAFAVEAEAISDADADYLVELAGPPKHVPKNAGQRLKERQRAARMEGKPLRQPVVDADMPAPAIAPDAALHDASVAALDDEEPGFVTRTRRHTRTARIAGRLMAVGAVLLMLALLGQSLYFFRNRIAASWPQTKPVLTQACAALGCRIGYPTQIDMVSLDAQELQTLPNQSLLLTSLLRNRSATVQSWPYIELTLTDSGDKAIARRVFAPADYLPPAELAKGMAPRSELAVKVYFELAQLKPSGYRVYIFYP